jgi:hypothetical protein
MNDDRAVKIAKGQRVVYEDKDAGSKRTDGQDMAPHNCGVEGLAGPRVR